VTGGNSFNSLSDALQRSCYTQMNDCQNAANKGGNKGGLTVQACSDQVSHSHRSSNLADALAASSLFGRCSSRLDPRSIDQVLYDLSCIHVW
jgi:hypothetical protein